MNFARCASYRVHQSRVSVRANVGLHAKVPLMVFWAEVHLRIAGFVVVLGRAANSNQCAVHHGAFLEQQNALNQQVMDGGQN